MTEWGGRRAQRALEQVRAWGEARGIPCCICGQPIDYRLRKPDPRSCSVQHVKPRRSFPHLTWDPRNWAPAHLLCNTAETQRTDQPLGVTSDW